MSNQKVILGIDPAKRDTDHTVFIQARRTGKTLTFKRLIDQKLKDYEKQINIS